MSHPYPSVDIVIPAFNSVDLTWRCLLHLQAFGLSSQRIVLVDDGSTDSTQHVGAWLMKQGAGHRYIRHPKNMGCHAAWNTGWRAFTNPAPVTCFINNDIAVLPGTMEALWHACAIVPRPYVAANQSIGKWDPGFLLSLPRSEQVLAGVDHYFNSLFMVKRSVLEDLNGFDERFYLVYGDTDFIERLRDKGHETCIVQDALCYHGGSMTRRREFGREKDVELELADRGRFEEKWAHRPDVLARHPSMPIKVMRSARDEYWSASESSE